MPKLKDEETIKDTYADEELKALLKKPSKQAAFCEYRNWVIINFFLNSGSCAADNGDACVRGILAAIDT